MTDLLVTDAGGATLNQVDVGNGITMPVFFDGPEKGKEYFDAIPNYEIKDDDIMLLSFAKTCTNWMYEILKMILNKSADRVKTGKAESMLEMIPPAVVGELPSPRVLNTHVAFRYIPKALRTKQTKTVLILRNPKDTAVSHYNHCKGIKMYGYNGEWKNFFPIWIQGKLEYGKYSDYLQGFDQAIQGGIGFPLHVMYYEDLKLNGPAEIDKLIKFLEVEIDAELKQAILENCNFKKMAKDKIPVDMAEKVFKTEFNFFRKGEIGDWSNWFTVAENDMFENIWHDQMKRCSRFTFKYGNDK